MEKIKPEKAVEMLKQKGVEVTVEQATFILEFLRKLANIIVAQHLDRQRKQ
ncbi:hypothetical protein SAMN04488128_102576 [Chitinophaga eiseniae]|uniref:Uncharacterized protein n=1 Tax=Chitinophaga eiseniae TaxID=634771 RepID=A0A1T4QSR1_9BACT|nr:hypothetical protein [Chitinophaga eiseniae]SKA06809.1 hypothetical protein SAMN04488128_102576 [Chitinophaga eiseniae]